MSLTALSWIAPYRNIFFAATTVALALAFGNVIVCRGRVSRVEWAILGGSTAAVIALVAYTATIEGLPTLW